MRRKKSASATNEDDGLGFHTQVHCNRVTVGGLAYLFLPHASAEAT